MDTFFSKLYKLDPQPSLYIFAENNSPDNTLAKVAKFRRPHEIIRFWLKDDWQKDATTMYDSIAIARQFLLQRARQLNPDYILYLDVDIFINQPDILDKIPYYPTDITGGAYKRIYPEGIQLAAYWPGPNGVGYVRREMPKFRPFDTTVAVVGGGYMAINNRLLQDKRINFYPLPPGGTSEDYYYSGKAKELGYKIGLDSGIKLGHLLTPAANSEKWWCVNVPPKSPIKLKKERLKLKS